MNHETITILLVEDNRYFAKMVKLYLERFDEVRFNVIMSENGEQGINELVKNKNIDLILMDYFLPGQNGLDVTMAIREKGISTPVIFLTVNKDINIALEAMKLGASDYIVKEEVSTPVFPKIILSVLERRTLEEKYAEFEISRKRLDAISEIAIDVTSVLEPNLEEMMKICKQLLETAQNEQNQNYFSIINDSIARIQLKIKKLKELKDVETITYVHDVKMIDLS